MYNGGSLKDADEDDPAGPDLFPPHRALLFVYLSSLSRRTHRQLKRNQKEQVDVGDEPSGPKASLAKQP